MKKKIIALCCITAMLLSTIGCNKDDTTEKTKKEETTIESQTNETTKHKPIQVDEETTEEIIEEPDDNEVLKGYVEKAKEQPKAIHYIVSKKMTDEYGSISKHTYFVIIYDSLKTIIYSMIDEDSETSGRCERYINAISPEQYVYILDRLPNRKIFEPLIADEDYEREITEDGNEIYNIKNGGIVYKDDILYEITNELFLTAYEDENDFTPELLSSAYGIYDENIYPYSPYSSWTDTIDTWLEEYIYDICMCFDDTIVYD